MDIVQSVLMWARNNPAHAILVASTGLMLLVALGMTLAASLLRRSNNRKARGWDRLEARWSSVLEQIIEGLLDESAVHDSVARAERLVFIDFLYKRQAQEHRRERRDLHARLAAPYLADLERRFRSGDVWQRSRALRTLAELYGRGGEATIRSALDDPSPLVATTAARAYARLRLGDVAPLLDRLDRYLEWDRRLLRLTLSAFGAAAAPALLARCEDPGAPLRTRVACADALLELDVPGRNEAASRLLEREHDLELVAASLRLPRAPLSPVLLEQVRALCSSPDAVVRAQAVGCLVRTLPSADELPEVRRARHDESPWVVLNARGKRPGWAAPQAMPDPLAMGGAS